MQQGDIISITDVQTLAGYNREILNVYNFLVVTMTAEAPLSVYRDEIAAAFRQHIINQLLPIQTFALNHVRLEMLNLTFQQEEAVYAWDPIIEGQMPGDYGPGNLTYSFRLQRSDRLVRNGRKSIAGVSDVAITNGRSLTPSYVSVVSSVSTALGTPIFVEGDTADATLMPIIMRKPLNPGVVPTVYSPVAQAVFRGFGTMNTRKEL